MFGIIDIGTYIIGTILIVILPGPNSLYVMSIASRFGIKTGYWGALGVFTGDLILILMYRAGCSISFTCFSLAIYFIKNCRCTLSVILRYKTLDCRSQNLEAPAHNSLQQVQIRALYKPCILFAQR